MSMYSQPIPSAHDHRLSHWLRGQRPKSSHMPYASRTKKTSIAAQPFRTILKHTLSAYKRSKWGDPRRLHDQPQPPDLHRHLHAWRSLPAPPNPQAEPVRLLLPGRPCSHPPHTQSHLLRGRDPNTWVEKKNVRRRKTWGEEKLRGRKVTREGARAGAGGAPSAA